MVMSSPANCTVMDSTSGLRVDLLCINRISGTQPSDLEGH